MVDFYHWNQFIKEREFCPKMWIFDFVKRKWKWCWVLWNWNNDDDDDDGGVGYALSLPSRNLENLSLLVIIYLFRDICFGAIGG